MKHFFRNNGLSLVLLLLFVLFWVGQALTGFREHNSEQREHGEPLVGMKEYLTSGHFWSATSENWESEFLQMAMFVLLTTCLYQKGSPESKDPDDDEDPVDADPRLSKDDPKAPLPVRKLPGIGPVAERELATLGIRTLGELADAPEPLQEPTGPVRAPHPAEDPVGTRLEREVDVLADGAALCHRGDHGVTEVLGVRTRESDPLDSVDGVARPQQLAELGHERRR